MCLDLIKRATNCDKNLKEKKNYPPRCFFFSHSVECGSLSQVAAYFLGNMGTKSFPHQPSIPDVRVGVGWGISV